MELRAECRFEGTPGSPVEIEVDEAVLRKVRSYNDDGVCTGTTHQTLWFI